MDDSINLFFFHPKKTGFTAESEHAANNGLEVARELLHKRIKSKYPDISYGDLYTLGAVVGVQEVRFI
jgi:cytochrome c peroxidase